ncbi:uncharacterized protein CBL_13599 [Carabus blaptoides fortunei]
MNSFIIVVAALVTVASAASLDWRIVGGEDAEEASSLSISAGSNTLNPVGTIYKVKKSIVHPGFNFGNLKDDIALVQINGEIEFNSKVQLIPLNTVNLGGDEQLTLTGWGALAFPGNTPNQLQKIVLKSVSVDECKQKLIGMPPVSEKQICTLNRVGEDQESSIFGVLRFLILYGVEEI